MVWLSYNMAFTPLMVLRKNMLESWLRLIRVFGLLLMMI